MYIKKKAGSTGVMSNSLPSDRTIRGEVRYFCFEADQTLSPHLETKNAHLEEPLPALQESSTRSEFRMVDIKMEDLRVNRVRGYLGKSNFKPVLGCGR